MISIDSAEISKRGDNLSSSLVMTANGDAGDGVAGDAPDVVDTRLLKEPWLQRLMEAAFDLCNFKHVKARRVIISSLS